MASCKLLVLALMITHMHIADGAVMKALQKRSLAAAGVPDPHCKTGIISLNGQSCCAGYCGACNDYDTCKSVNGQDSENACCASKVYKMRCGNAPANVCLKTCSEAVPPCIVDKDVDAMRVKLGAKTYKGVPPCNEVVPFTRKSHARAITKGEFLVDLHVSDSDLKQALDMVKSAKAKLQKDAKKADLPKEISAKYDAAIKRAEKVLADVPKSISKVQELQKKVTANKVGTKIPKALELKVQGEMDNAEVLRRDAEEVKEASQSLHQEALDHAAEKLAGASDKQADQYAKAQASAADKADAAAKAKEAVAKLKEAAAAAAAKAKKLEGEKKAAAEAAAAKATAAAAKAKEEAAKLKAAAEAAAAKAKKQEEQKKAAEKALQKVAKKACADKLSGLPCGQEWAFVTDSKSNLVAIKKGPKTGSGKTEVHRLSAASNYNKFDLQAGTPLHITDSNWDFVMDSKDNLVAILKGPKTGSGKTEVHILSAASNYQSWVFQTGTGLDYSGGGQWAFTMDSKDNLVCVKKGPTGSDKTEVHRLTASSNYKNFDLHTATGLHRTDAAAGKGDWDFLMDPEDNLVCILKGPTSGSGKTEVHKLSSGSNFKKFVLHTSTALHYSEGWEFAMAKNHLFAILKGPTSGSCMTEVHMLNGGPANYGKFIFQTGTALDLSAATSCAR